MALLAKSLISRVIICNVLLVLLGGTLFTLYHVRREQETLYNASRESTALLLSTIERCISNSMRLGNVEEVQTTLQMVGRSSHLADVRIFHPSGLILRSAQPGEVGQIVDPETLELFRSREREGVFSTDGEDVMGIVRPIYSEPACVRCHGPGEKVLGVLNLNLSLGKTQAQLRSTSQIFLVSGVLMVAVLSLGISVVMLRFVKRPLQRMTETMSRVETGDLGARMTAERDDEIGRLMGSFNSMLDNLEAARAELEQYHFQQMERADRLASVGEMATGIAHEIKNPLAGISGAMSVLSDTLDAQDERREVLRQVLQQIDRLNKTATDLLHFGRPAKPEFVFADINQLVEDTLFFVGQHPEARNVEQVKDLCDGLPPAWIDQKQIQQVLFNIIVNALQEMQEGGTLRISSEHVASEQKARVTIADTGQGIPMEQLNNIFTPFYTTKTQGTGLGLAICRQLMQQNRGDVRVESRPGEGSTFILELPVKPLPGA